MKTITQGSKIVLPLYPALFVLVGGILVVQGSSRTSGPSWETAKSVMPIHTWGVLFFTVGAVEALSWWRENRRLFLKMLVVGSSLCAFWATLFMIQAIQDSRVSWTGPVWLFFAAGCHMASARSLSRDFVLGDDEKT